MPRTWSVFSPMTGIREYPERRNSDIARCRLDPESMVRMSVRGTMTERTRVSPKSKTDWISSASLSSITSDSVARSTSSRNSSSLKNASLSAGAPGATALPKAHQPARDRAQHGAEGADQRGAEADQGGGVDPAELPRGHPDDHEAEQRHDAGGDQPGEPDVVQHAVQEDGHGDGGGHLEPDAPEPQGAHVRHGLRQDALERRCPGCAGPPASASCRDRKLKADSAAVSTAAKLRNTSAMPARISGVTESSLTGPSLPVKAESSSRCSPNISSFSSGSAWSIAQQVQDAVRGEQQHLVLGGVAGVHRLDLGHLRADGDVAEHALRRRLVRGARGQLVHGHGEDIGGAGLVHQFDVQLFHGRFVHEQDGQFGLRVDVEAFEDETGQRPRARPRRRRRRIRC